MCINGEEYSNMGPLVKKNKLTLGMSKGPEYVEDPDHVCLSFPFPEDLNFTLEKMEGWFFLSD